ncbi:flagellar export chaperone FliS [Devosia sp. CN2-171]|uniref:flagellar export chaperone FliS n=1 Tax=Devosia sp. CN2-171 TaxID=3400909 RepID=UPI003BF8C3E8
MTQNLAHAIGAYRVAATQVHPLVAVVKLFDETLRRIALTISSIEEKRHEDAYVHVSRASLILRGLAGNLNFEVGRDVAETLKQTYVSNMIALHTAYGKKDAVARYRKIRSGLLELRNAWATVAGMSQLDR